MGNTLAFRNEEGRGYRRNVTGNRKHVTIRKSPNEETLKHYVEYININE